ncbi:MAG: DUF928 domain-containing protein [Cyanobacteria bacterium P01_A01_bin.114]
MHNQAQNISSNISSKCIKLVVQFILVSLVNLGYTLTAQASEDAVRWTPSEDRGQVGGTLSGGRRGQEAACETTEDSTQLTLLVPSSGESLLTTVANPTFSWHIATQTATEMEFVLFDPRQAAPIYSQTVQANTRDLISVSLPMDKALEAGIRYRWTVIANCPDGTNREIYTRSFIERQDRATLDQVLINSSSLDQAVAYAAEGIWYDALGQLLDARSQEPDNIKVQAALESLLHQAMSEEAEAYLAMLLIHP